VIPVRHEKIGRTEKKIFEIKIEIVLDAIQKFAFKLDHWGVQQNTFKQKCHI